MSLSTLWKVPAGARGNGGDGLEYPNTLTKALPLTRDIDVIITGHGGGLAKPQDLEAVSYTHLTLPTILRV